MLLCNQGLRNTNPKSYHSEWLTSAERALVDLDPGRPKLCCRLCCCHSPIVPLVNVQSRLCPQPPQDGFVAKSHGDVEGRVSWTWPLVLVDLSYRKIIMWIS
jgi:hypothetical protein